MRKGQAAEQAGLKEKDVVLAVGSTPVTNLLDFELGIFRVRKQPVACLTVARQGTGTLTVDLPLEKPGSPHDVPPGKRRNPVEEGRVEFSPMNRLSTR